MANRPPLLTVIAIPELGSLRAGAMLLALALGAHCINAAAQLHTTQAAPATILPTTPDTIGSGTITSATIVTTIAQPSAATEEDELRSFLRQTIASADSFGDRFDAEVWLVDMSARLRPFIKDPTARLDFLRVLHREATASGLKPDLVLALIEVESGFDSYAVSRAGAQGLMQVMPFWKNEIGRPEDNLINTQTNLSYGCRILQFYLNKERGNWMNALARYNGSYGKYWYSERVMDAWQARWLVR